MASDRKEGVPLVDNIETTPAVPTTVASPLGGVTVNAEWVEREQQKLSKLNERIQATINVLSMRAQILRERENQVRNYNYECKWPDTFSAWDYQHLYERNSIAARVVEVLPRESWKVQPLVYEDDDPSTDTPFEKTWNRLSASIQGEKSWHKEESGGSVMEHLQRIDELCGIGHYGIILLGLDDGQELHMPVKGEGLERGSGWGHMTPAVRNMVVHNVMPAKGGVWSDTQDVDLSDRSKLVGNVASLDGPPPVSAPLRRPSINRPSDIPDVFKGRGGSTSSTDPGGTPSPSGAGGLGGQGGGPSVAGGETRKTPSPHDDPSGQGMRLIYLRTFPEYLCPVSVWDADRTSPRYGHPVMYLVTFNDPSEGQYTGIGLATGTRSVHWTRVVHVVDNLGSSEIFGIPRMRTMLNELLDITKVRGGGAEGYWQCCFPVTSFETVPSLGGDVDVNIQGLKDMAEQVREGLQRIYTLSGISAKNLSPSVVDPTPHLDKCIEFICIKLAIAVRIFKGSERGELASSQDDDQHNDRMASRQKNHITPRVIVPFVNRLIALGVLAPPSEENGFKVHWPDLTSTSADQKAGTALKLIQTLSAYISGKCDTALSPMDFWTKIVGLSDEEARSLIEAATGVDPLWSDPEAGGTPDGSIASTGDEQDEDGQDDMDMDDQNDDGDHWGEHEPTGGAPRFAQPSSAARFDLPGGGGYPDPTATYAPRGMR